MTVRSANRRAKTTAARLHRSLATDVQRMREDAGVTRSELARGAGVDAGYLWRIEAGTERPSLEIYARLADALGADLAARLYPNTGPTIRDRHQAAMLEALLGARHPRWHAYPEAAVRRPARGWIDVGLHDAASRIFVATEIQSELRRLEQLIRWASEKAGSLRSWDRWASLGEEPEISMLLVIRATRTTRAVAREFGRLLRTAYPAHPDDALAALTGPSPWPGASILWATTTNTTGQPAADGIRIVARP